MKKIAAAAAAGGAFVPQVDIEEFAQLWRLAETRVKRTEQVRGALTVPAVNELRYAGYHLLEALVARTSADAAEEVGKAKKHAKRAAFDACEAEILFRCEQIKKFQDDYATVEISVPGFDYISVRQAFREAQKALIFNADAQRLNRDEHYELAMQHCDPLKKAVEAAEDARDELNKKRAGQAKELRRWKIGTGVAVVAAIAAIAGIVVTVRANTHPIASAPAAQQQASASNHGTRDEPAKEHGATPIPAPALAPAALQK